LVFDSNQQFSIRLRWISDSAFCAVRAAKS
jgi:hypothetical protein